jgi:hypothetical protein
MVLLLINAGATGRMVWWRSASENMVDKLQYLSVSDNNALRNQTSLTNDTLSNELGNPHDDSHPPPTMGEIIVKAMEQLNLV